MVLREHGGPEVLKLEQLPIPEPGPGEVRVRIRAVAVNHLDIWVRRGGPAFKLEYPHRLGSDVAGEVDAVGPGTAREGRHEGRRPTRRVVHALRAVPRRATTTCAGSTRSSARTRRARTREYIVVPEVNLAPYPERLTMPEAAASILPFLTAWQMVVHKAQVAPGDTVLVQGAGSGVGVAAIQICKLYGARVIATASTADKLARAKALGADEVIDYTTQDFVAECKRLTGKRGVDAVIEHVGGEVFANSIRAVAHRRPDRDVRRDRRLSSRDRSAPHLLSPDRGPRLDDGRARPICSPCSVTSRPASCRRSSTRSCRSRAPVKRIACSKNARRSARWCWSHDRRCSSSPGSAKTTASAPR